MNDFKVNIPFDMLGFPGTGMIMFLGIIGMIFGLLYNVGIIVCLIFITKALCKISNNIEIKSKVKPGNTE